MQLFFLQTSHASTFCVAFSTVRSKCNTPQWEKAPPDPLHFALAHPQREKWAHLEDSDNGPQQGVKILPVRNCISCVCPEAELATKDVHSQDAVGTRSGDSVKYKCLCHHNELIKVILFSSNNLISKKWGVQQHRPLGPICEEGAVYYTPITHQKPLLSTCTASELFPLNCPSNLLSSSFSFAFIFLHLPTTASDELSWLPPATFLPVSLQSELFLQPVLITKRLHLSYDGTLCSTCTFGGSISPTHPGQIFSCWTQFSAAVTSALMNK